MKKQKKNELKVLISLKKAGIKDPIRYMEDIAKGMQTEPKILPFQKKLIKKYAGRLLIAGQSTYATNAYCSLHQCKWCSAIFETPKKEPKCKCICKCHENPVNKTLGQVSYCSKCIFSHRKKNKDYEWGYKDGFKAGIRVSKSSHQQRLVKRIVKMLNDDEYYEGEDFLVGVFERAVLELLKE